MGIKRKKQYKLYFIIVTYNIRYFPPHGNAVSNKQQQQVRCKTLCVLFFYAVCLFGIKIGIFRLNSNIKLHSYEFKQCISKVSNILNKKKKKILHLLSLFDIQL